MLGVVLVVLALGGAVAVGGRGQGAHVVLQRQGGAVDRRLHGRHGDHLVGVEEGLGHVVAVGAEGAGALHVEAELGAGVSQARDAETLQGAAGDRLAAVGGVVEVGGVDHGLHPEGAELVDDAHVGEAVELGVGHRPRVVLQARGEPGLAAAGGLGPALGDDDAPRADVLDEVGDEALDDPQVGDLPRVLEAAVKVPGAALFLVEAPAVGHRVHLDEDLVAGLDDVADRGPGAVEVEGPADDGVDLSVGQLLVDGGRVGQLRVDGGGHRHRRIPLPQGQGAGAQDRQPLHLQRLLGDGLRLGGTDEEGLGEVEAQVQGHEGGDDRGRDAGADPAREGAGGCCHDDAFQGGLRAGMGYPIAYRCPLSPSKPRRCAPPPPGVPSLATVAVLCYSFSHKVFRRCPRASPSIISAAS